MHQIQLVVINPVEQSPHLIMISVSLLLCSMAISIYLSVLKCLEEMTNQGMLIVAMIPRPV